MYPDRDDIRLSERERQAIAELEAAFSQEAARLKREQGASRPRPKARHWIGPAAVVGTGTMLMALAMVSSLWLIVCGALLLVGGIALLAAA